MADITSPIALDESFNTTETTPRNIADVVADETGDLVTQATAIVTKLQALINAVKPNASDIPLDPITGMSANNVQSGISELKGTLTTKIGFADISNGSINDITETGIYYLRNAVTGKPVNQNGMFIVTSISSSVKLGIYVPNATNGYFYVCTWENSTWVGHLNATS